MKRLALLAAGITIFGIAQGAEQKPAEQKPAEQKPGYQLTLVDIQGQKKVLGTVLDSAIAPRVSPDGKQVAFEQLEPPAAAGDPALLQIYVADMDKLDQRHELRGAVIVSRNLSPVWSVHGDYIAFLAAGNGADAVFEERSNGSEQPRYLLDGQAPEGMYRGGMLTFLTLTGERDYGISSFNMDTKKITKLVDQPGSAQHSSSISPDGQWIAYASDETGKQQVWLEPLPSTGKRVQLTKSGGNHPEWSADGKSLYFEQDGQIYKMDVTAGAQPSANTPVALPIKGFLQTDQRRQYDLMPDGSGFVMLFPASAPATK